MNRTIAILSVLLLFVFGSTKGQLWQSVGGGFYYPTTYCMYADSALGLLYVGGRFDRAGDSAVCQIAAWDGLHWNKVGMHASDTTCPYTHADFFSMIRFQGLLFASGQFHNLNGSPAGPLLIQGNGQQWSVSGNPNSFPVFEVTNGQLFGMGAMSEINGFKVGNMARWDPLKGWEPFGDSLPTPHGDGWLISSEYYRGNYYFAGNFNPPNSPLKEIAYWDGLQWNPLQDGIPNDTWVNKIKIFKDQLFVGGEFYASNGFPSAYIAGWDGSQWYNPFPFVEYFEQVRDIQVIDGELFVLGGHRVWNGNSWQGPYQLAKYDGQQFCSFGGQDIYPRDIAGVNGRLYVTTTYTTHPDPFNGIAEWIGGNITDICISQPVHSADPTSTEAFAVSLHPNPTSTAFSLTLPANATSAQIQIRDPQGRAVAPQQAYTGRPVDVSALAQGLYFVEVSWRSGRAVLKVIKV